MVSQVSCRFEIASKEDCKTTFFPKPIDVTRMEGFFRVDLVARLFFEGIDKGIILVREKECMAEVTGCFIEQIPPTDRGHHPAEHFKEYKDYLIDQIGVFIDPKKDCSSGKAKWEIPVELLVNHRPIKVTIIQEYILEKRVLTILKGGSMLFQCPIDEVSDTTEHKEKPVAKTS